MFICLIVESVEGMEGVEGSVGGTNLRPKIRPSTFHPNAPLPSLILVPPVLRIRIVPTLGPV
jgi:hypothetical protein